VRALAPALLIVTACVSCGGESTAPDATPASIDLFEGQSSAAMSIGVEIAVPVSVRDARGSQLATPLAFSLASRNPAVITVEPGNHIKSRSAGFAWIVGSLAQGSRVIADSVYFAVSCPLVLVISIKPDSAVLNVGEKFTPTVELFGCGGAERITDDLSYSAFFPTNSTVTGIVSVDAATGETTGLKPGNAWTVVRSTRYGQIGAIPVTVR
jgi:hypothetical protein